MNSKSGSSLQVSEYSLCHRCMHFERLDIGDNVIAPDISTDYKVMS